MNQQPKPQTQPGQQPDHRFDELQTQIRQLMAQNQQLRGHLDAVAQRQNPPAQEEESPFKPEVMAHLQRLIQKEINPVKQHVSDNIGMLYDSQDEQRYLLKYSDPRWDDYRSDVERLREDQKVQGKWISREQALQMAFFEKTGKKPPEPQKATAQPKWDTYFNAFVDPTTGLPVAPPAQAPEQEQVQQVQAQQVPAQPAQQWQPPAPQAQQFQQQIPNGFQNRPPAQQNPFALPDQGVNSQYSQPQQNQPQSRELSINASDAELAAFEKTMGDIPF